MLLYTLISLAIAIDSTDQLGGAGFFSDESLWTLNQTTGLTFERLTNTTTNQKVIIYQSQFLVINKAVDQVINFHDGYYTKFTKSQPQHIRFEFASGDKEIEDTNLRLKDSDNDKTAVSFRCGYAGFVRVNDNQMISFYNKSVSTADNIQWTQADIVMDWDSREVLVWINQEYMGSAGFYHNEVIGVNQVLLYNLHQNTTSWWRNLEVCKERCVGFVYSSVIIVSMLLVLSI